jgi:predicted nucleotidyltransferase
MNGKQVKDRLLPFAPELTAAGIFHLSIHGSAARGEASVNSDVDLIAEFDHSSPLSLFSKVHLENRLTDILGVRTDLADRGLLRPEVLERAQREAIIVF